MKPTLGRIVLYHDNTPAFVAMNNHSYVCVAVIVRVWSDTCVNLKLLLDGNAVEWRTSVNLDNEQTQVQGWSWPPRV